MSDPMRDPMRAGAAGSSPVAEPLLRVEDLAVEYLTDRGPMRAVDGVTFQVAAGGEALGLIGESGSGKSSITNAVSRLLPRNARVAGGRIILAGEEIGGLSDEAFRTRVRWSRIAVVVQGAMASLNPVIRIMDQGTERLRADGMRRADAEARFAALLDRVGLPSGIGRRYPHELSGGMKQRTIIAMALTHDPQLLVLDEPTSALDVSIQAQIMNLLKELKRERGIGMLFITHDLALASDLCDRVAVVYGGQIRELATTDAILADPRDPYAQRLLASIPRIHEPTPPGFLPGAPPDLRVPIPGCRFAARCPLAFERCHLEPPPLVRLDDDHEARCFLSADGPLPAVRT
jgi:ABC-type dipeptide/oligopeptide/nickel transport system ATPase component